MKLMMDERVKHRLVGLAVILSIGAIFAPAIIKKSSQRFEEKVSISVELPPKPLLPQISAATPKQVFKQVKVAKVTIPAINETFKPETTIAKAQSLSQKNKVKVATLVAKAPPVMAINNKQEKAKVQVSMAKKPQATPPVKKNVVLKPSASLKAKSATSMGYGVQLATFSQQSNALSLVHVLKNKGYKATLNKVSQKNGALYKVVVGQVNQRKQAEVLQQKLASSTKLNGFIVPTRIS